MFELLEETFRSEGPEAVFELLIGKAREARDHRMLFGARIMQVRHRTGLPLIETESVLELAGEQRTAYENAFRDAAREAGELCLASGDIPSGWAYFKAIGEPAPVVAAIEKVSGGDNPGENLDRVIEIAYREGVNPRKGFELILRQHGICSAITWYGSNPDQASRQQCLRLLVRHLYDQVMSAMKETIARAEGAAPEAGSLAELIAGREWLFEGMASYTDSTHLSSILRYSPELEDQETLRLAVELAEYGRRLDPMYHFKGDPPFEDTYADHAIYLRALMGEDVDAAIAHFRGKASEPARYPGDTAAGEVLVDLLVRVGRTAEALEASVEYLAEAEGPTNCPSTMQLCQLAGDYGSLRKLARQREDLLGFAAGVVQG